MTLWAPRGQIARWLVLVAMALNLVASLAMALVLRNATSAGGEVADRMAFIHEHTLWVSGAWYSWVLASCGLVVVMYTILRSLPISVEIRGVVLAILLLGAVPDIVNNLVGAAVLPMLAERWSESSEALRPAIEMDFEAWDRFSVVLTGALGNFFYATVGFLLVAITHRVKGFPRSMVWLGLPLWTATLGISAASIVDSVPALICTVATTMTLFCVWCTGIAFLWLGERE
ncbi:MAG: hypothetical protein QGG40_12715 [Myxococcota bacterium]|nr:hypothetical protein [Myxococcota bacterium]